MSKSHGQGSRKARRKSAAVPNVSMPGSAAANPKNGGGAVPAIQECIDLLKNSNLTELEVEHGGVRIRLKREAPPTTIVPTIRGEAPPSTGETPAARLPDQTAQHPAGLVTVRSPIVGTFYRSPSPDADPYVEEGDQVKKGQVLCIVEAMKLMNEIESEVDGRIVKILAENTKPVEYGQPLYLIDPTPAS